MRQKELFAVHCTISAWYSIPAQCTKLENHRTSGSHYQNSAPNKLATQNRYKCPCLYLIKLRLALHTSTSLAIITYECVNPLNPSVLRFKVFSSTYRMHFVYFREISLLVRQHSHILLYYTYVCLLEALTNNYMH